jgi:hypothetical protein
MTSEITYDALKAHANGRHIVVLGGYSSEYHPDDLRDIEQFIDTVAQQAKLSGERMMVVIGATPMGIGAAYDMLKQKIAYYGLPADQIVTAGIVSAKHKNDEIAKGCDFVTFVDAVGDGRNGGSREVKVAGKSLMVDIAHYGTSAQFNYFGGGEVSAAEIAEAISLGFPVFVKDMRYRNGDFGREHISLMQNCGARKTDGWFHFASPVRNTLPHLYGVQFALT